MTSAGTIYLDNHASTRLDPRVLEAMLPWLTDHYGNAGSVTHELGREARAAVEEARGTFAASIGATPREIVFTSGATEATNLALMGVAARIRRLTGGVSRGHFITLATEHAAVLDPLEHLEREGFSIARLPVARQDDRNEIPGRVRLADLRRALRPDTTLVSVLVANNEIGVIQDLPPIAAAAHEAGAVVHVDAAQALGRMPVDVDSLGVDLASFSGHKIHGPKGSGALYVRRRGRAVRLEPLVFGGGQERGLRSGTLDVPAIVGLAEAARLAVADLGAEQAHLQAMRDRLWAALVRRVPGIELNGPPLDARDDRGQSPRLVNNLNVHIPGVDGQTLLATLDAAGLAVSSGSACASESPRPSHVLAAIGRDDDQARASLRFGVSRFTTPDEVDRAAALIAGRVAELRAV